MSASKYPTLHMAVPFFNKILDHFEDKHEEYNKKRPVTPFVVSTEYIRFLDFGRATVDVR